MKKCGVRPLTAAAGLLLALSWFAICFGGLGYLLLHPGMIPESEHQQFFLAGCLLCFAGIHLIRRCLSLVRYSVEYDDFCLHFHFPDGCDRLLSWHELPRKVSFAKVRTGWQLTFSDDGRTFPLHRSAHGFRDLSRTLRQQGFLP